MDISKPEVVGFEYHHSIDGTGWPDTVVLEVDDANECEQRRYRQMDGVDVEALQRLADGLEQRAELGLLGGYHAETCLEAAAVIRRALGAEVKV